MVDDRRQNSRRFFNILQKEREILLSGRFEELERLLTEKQEAFDAITSADLDNTQLAELRTKSGENQKLLESTMNGIRFVHDRIGFARNSGRQFDTYDVLGNRTPIKADRRKAVEKRA